MIDAEKRKEIITKKEFIVRQRKQTWNSLWLITLLVIPLFTVLLVFIAFTLCNHWILFAVLETLLLVALICFGYVPSIRTWRQIQKGNLRITEDTLQGSTPGHGTHSSGFAKYYTLRFSTYGKYQIPPHNYMWSKEFQATDEDVYNRACEGDTFYLFMVGKTILEAYNTKTFEYKED